MGRSAGMCACRFVGGSVCQLVGEYDLSTLTLKSFDKAVLCRVEELYL